jgi:1-acyl-sn-glycerol-3-phosphate acyltransferase
MRPSPFYMFAGIVSQPLKWLYRLRAEGVENVPEEGGFVLAANHLSNLDPWPLGLPLFPKRYLRFMAKSELFWWPLGPIIAAIGGFEVRRGEADRNALSTARRLAREGNVVAMFPEGTRRTKGLRKRRQAEVHDGAARIALGAGVPLVPAALAGTDRLGHLAKLRVLYGAPISVEDLAGLPRRQAARIATERLMARIHELEGELASD